MTTRRGFLIKTAAASVVMTAGVRAAQSATKGVSVTNQVLAEPIIDPELPIVDPHHHLWFMPQALLAKMLAPDDPLLPLISKTARYLFDGFMADLTTGHNVRATVFVDAHAMYRAS